MDDPELYDDETVILTTRDIFIKSIPFEAYLTDKRIILLDRKKNLIPPKGIPLETIRDIETGENAIRDPVLILYIVMSNEDKRQMILTFSRYGGGVRIRDRDDWHRALKKLIGSSGRRSTPAATEQASIKEMDPSVKPRSGITERLSGRKDPRTTIPIEKIENYQPLSREPEKSAPLPYGSFCSRCGNRLATGSVYCNRCGAKVTIPVQDTTVRERADSVSSDTRRQWVSPPGEQLDTTQRKPAQDKGAQPMRSAGGFFSGLFPRKGKRKKAVPAAGDDSPRHPVGDSSGGFRMSLFQAIDLIAIILIVVAGGAFVYFNYLTGALPVPGESPDAPPGPAPSPSPPSAITPKITIVRTESTPMIMPSDGVYVRVSYLGSWRGSYGITGSLVSAAQSGDVNLKVENATGTVQASFRKDDTSLRPHELVVEIYKNGALVKRGVTTEMKGQVEISVNLATAKPITVATTVSSTPLPTTSNR